MDDGAQPVCPRLAQHDVNRRGVVQPRRGIERVPVGRKVDRRSPVLDPDVVTLVEQEFRRQRADWPARALTVFSARSGALAHVREARLLLPYVAAVRR
jgi:hypothetical protein